MNINITLALLQDEIQYAVEEGIGNCSGWTSVKVFEKLLRIVALASGRIFVGRPLCRDEEWIRLITNYTVDSSNAIKDVQEIPVYIRPFISPFLSSIRRAAAYRRKVAEKLKPQLNEMIEANKRIQNEDDDLQFDGVQIDQHNLATWSLVSAP
jgi:gliotoxin biosynthesis cytochrome P450 monooxygenase